MHVDRCRSKTLRRASTALVALVLMLASASSVVAGVRDHWRSDDALIARADSLQREGRPAMATAYLDSLGRAAEANGDAGLSLAVSLARTRAHVNSNRVSEAASALRELRVTALARKDTIALCRVHRYLGRIEELGRRTEAARASYLECRRLATRAGLLAERGMAELAMAALHAESGAQAQAEAHFSAALRELERVDEPRSALRARAGRARALQNLGRNDEARSEHLRALLEARRLREPTIEADTQTNLAALELAAGDPTRAPAHYREALSIYQRLAWRERVLFVSRSLALHYLSTGRLSEADSILSSVRTESERSPDPATRALFLSQLGVLRRLQKRFGEAVELGRAAVALSDSLPVIVALEGTGTLSGTFKDMGQPALALESIDSQLARLRSRASEEALLPLQNHRAPMLRAVGRPREALVILRRAAARMGPIAGAHHGAQQLLELSELARCHQDLGRLDSATIVFERVARSWEAWRNTSTDPGWRESYDDFARRFQGEQALALLDRRRDVAPARRVSDAFEALQRFRARTMEERVHGPGPSRAASAASWSTADLRRRVLQPGEVLVDLQLLAETTLVFVMTRDTLTVHGAPPGSDLIPRLERLAGMLASPAAEASALMVSAPERLGMELFGPAAGILRSAKRVVLACGSSSRLPFEQLVIPGERAALGHSREVARTPSAARLASLRRAGASRAERSMLAVAQSSHSSGRAIAAAEREVSWLARRFQEVDRLAGAAVSDAAAIGTRAPHYRVLHLAAHTRSGGDRPWQDAIQVGSSRTEESWLTASQIAALRLPGTLCVLAGCSTLTEEARSRETLEGIGPACLAAGARAVVATLWKVDDEATFALMQEFYEQLAAGRTTGAALLAAQARVRSSPARSHPYFWAGVVLLGDPSARVALKSR